MMKFAYHLLFTLLFMTFAAGASASTGVSFPSTVQFDFWGFSTDPHPIDIGDMLEVVAVVDEGNTSVPLGLDFATYEYTVYIHGLELAELVPNPPLVEYHYTGGVAGIYADPSFNAPFTATTDPEAVPPLDPAVVPRNFKDGELLVQYTFLDCIMLFHPVWGIGSIAYTNTELRATRGSGLGQLHNLHMTVGWHMGGGYTDDSSGYIPEGYAMRFDPVIKWENPLPTNPATWGGIKAAFE